MVRRHQAEQIVRRGSAGDDVGRADVYAGTEEDVELRAVIEGQRVKDDVAFRDFGVHQAGDVFGDDGLVSEDRALRPRFGTARVDDLRRPRSVAFTPWRIDTELAQRGERR